MTTNDAENEGNSIPKNASLSEQMKSQQSRLETLEKTPIKSESGEFSDRPNADEMRAEALKSRRFSSSFRIPSKKSPLLRTLPAPGTPRSTRRGAAAPAPHSPIAHSFSSRNLKEIMEKVSKENGSNGSSFHRIPHASSVSQQNSEKIKSLETKIFQLEEKLNETVITHHDQAEIQNKVITRLQRSRRKSKKKLKQLQKQLVTVSKNLELSTKEIENFDQESSSSFATGASVSRSGSFAGGMPNLHLFQMGEMMKSMNQMIEKQKEMMIQQQKEIEELKRKVSNQDERKQALFRSNNAIGYAFSMGPANHNKLEETQTNGDFEENDEENSEEISETFSPSDLEKFANPRGANRDKHRALAVFDFVANRSGDLSFSEGDLITILKKYNDGWWLGKCASSGKLGRFPSNYIEELTDESFLVVGIEGLKAEEEGDLEFEAGDVIIVLKKTEEAEGWWFGELEKDGSTGWFPSTYIVPIE